MMTKKAGSWVLGVLLLVGFPSATLFPLALKPVQEAPQPFSAILHYNVYTFSVSAARSGVSHELIIRAVRGQVLLTQFRLSVDGAVVGAQVADLDGNRFPELYVYTSSDGSGSLGRVYAWQFLPARMADIILSVWEAAPVGYMGHDSLWVEQNSLCRRYPVYRSGDANAQPSGGFAVVRYQLQPAGEAYVLVPKP